MRPIQRKVRQPDSSGHGGKGTPGGPWFRDIARDIVPKPTGRMRKAHRSHWCIILQELIELATTGQALRIQARRETVRIGLRGAQKAENLPSGSIHVTRLNDTECIAWVDGA